MVLPRLTWERRFAAASFVVVFVAALYLLPMYVPVNPPVALHPSAIDRAIPFLDWTVWVYYSYAVFLVLPFAACRDEAVLMDAFYSVGANSILAAVIFWVWPTAGLTQEPTADGATGLLWTALQTIDRPMNLLPSLHIANTCTCALALRGERRWRELAPIWAILIATSTLTTKQHLFADVLGGVLLAGVSTVLVRALARRRRPAVQPIR